MSIEINTVLQSGTVQWPGLKYDSTGRPEFRFTLYREDQTAEGKTIPFSFPCCAVGHTGEKLAGELDEGMHILVSVGELCYRKRQTQKHGEITRMEILVWRVQILDRVPEPVAEQLELNAAPEPPPAKTRRRPYPRQALQGGFSEN